ncbi:hypothetical protein ASE07_05825 [Noviherbaspirillum sp. Root189]|nr:hypothetical protein ASE07_05825 [Noviherbaspirillum sp. Root189]
MQPSGYQRKILYIKTACKADGTDRQAGLGIGPSRTLSPHLNTANPNLIVRVPGIGLRNARRLVELRRARRIRYADLARLRCSMDKLKPFIVTADYRPQHDT